MDGLCRNWGFYITCADGASSRDSFPAHVASAGRKLLDGKKVEVLPKTHGVDKVRAHENFENAKKACLSILLARVAVLSYFIRRIPYPQDTGYKKLWLLFQLFPTGSSAKPFAEAGWDVFARLETFFAESSFSNEILEHLISQELVRVRKAMVGLEEGPLNQPLPSGKALKNAQQLYCVVDEAQSADAMLSGCFVSDENPETRRSFLKPLIQSFTKPVFVIKAIVSGTGLTTEQLSEVVESNWASSSLFQKRHETGWYNTPAAQKDYMRLYIPPHLLATDSFKILLMRAWRWLRGR